MRIDERPLRPLLRKIARWVLFASAGLGALYLAAMNVFLGTRAFRDLISFDPESFRVEYARAYSLLPGRIHVEGLAIRGRDSSVEWILHLDRCDFRVSFFDLLRRRFHANHVRGHGLSFRLRLRVAEATAAHLAALPPVPGFLDPPRKDAGPPSPPLSDAQYKLWSVQLDDVDADPVRELWIDTLRYTGDLRVRGRWFFRPMRWLEVGPAIVDARALDVGYGMQPLVTGAQGVIDVTVHPYDVRVPKGLEVLDSVSASASLRAHLRVADALQAFVPDGMAFPRGEGPLDLGFHLDHGVVRMPTHIAVEAGDMQASAAGVAMDAAMRGTFDVTPGEEGRPLGTARLEASSIDAARDNGACVHAAAAVGVLTSRELKLSHAFGDATFRVEVQDAETQSLHPWLPPSSQLDLNSGPARATADAEGTLSDARGGGHLSFSIENLALAHDADRVATSVSGMIAVRNASLRDETFALDESHVTLTDATAHTASLTVSAGSLALKGEGTASVPEKTIEGQATAVGENIAVKSGRFEGRAHVDARAQGKSRWGEGRFELAAGDARLQSVQVRLAPGALRAPLITLSAEKVSLGPEGLGGAVGIDLPRADTDDLARLARAAPLPSDVTVTRGVASAALRLAVDLGTRTASGSAAIDARDVGARLASKALSGNLSLRVQAERRGDSTDLSGSTLAFDSLPSAADPSGEGWWGRADIRQAELRVTDALAFRAHLHLAAKDASPIAAVVGSQTPIPPWILAAVPFHELVADGNVRAARSELEVRSFAATGGSDKVELEYDSQNRKTQWALLVEAGPLGAGFHMRDGHFEFVLFDARPWYEARVAALRASNEP